MKSTHDILKKIELSCELFNKHVQSYEGDVKAKGIVESMDSLLDHTTSMAANMVLVQMTLARIEALSWVIDQGNLLAEKMKFLREQNKKMIKNYFEYLEISLQTAKQMGGK